MTSESQLHRIDVECWLRADRLLVAEESSHLEAAEGGRGGRGLFIEHNEP